jgi:hypothetical protein
MNRHRLGITVIAASAVLAAVLVLSAAALAGSEATTSVKVKSGPPAFHGIVKSDEKLCVANRYVLIKKQKRNGGGNKTLGAALADDNGNWTIKVHPLTSGAYFAKVPKAIDVAPAMSCVGAKSAVQVAD